VSVLGSKRTEDVFFLFDWTRFYWTGGKDLASLQTNDFFYSLNSTL
jgi:hypothetical protein